jgi:hypothetical protein
MRIIATEFQKDTCTSVTCNDFTKAFTADMVKCIQVKKKCLFTPSEEGVLQSVTFLALKFSKCSCLNLSFIMLDFSGSKFIFFPFSSLIILSRHSFNHHFSRIHYHRHYSLSLGCQSFNQHSQDKISFNRRTASFAGFP